MIDADLAARLFSWSNWIAVGGAFLVAIGAGGIFWFGSIKDAFSEQWRTAAESKIESVTGPKHQIRELLQRVDPRIIQAIDAGDAELEIRIEPYDLGTLEGLIALQGEPRLISVSRPIREIRNSVIMNGSLGPSAAVPLQYVVRLMIEAPIREN